MTMNDIAVIGGGPAGASAAVFLARAKLSTLVLDADQGITRRAQLDNAPGFPEGITGPAFVDKGHEHIKRAGATLVKAKIASLTKKEDGFLLTAEGGETFEAKQVLLATGVGVDLAKQAGVDVKPATEPRIKEIVAVDGEGRTNVAGVWAAGTVAGVSVHVAVTAGDGARVAINIVSALRGQRHVDHDVLPAPQT